MITDLRARAALRLGRGHWLVPPWVAPALIGCAVVLLPWPLMQGLPAFGAAWGWLAGLGVLHTGLAYVVLYAGMARLGTGRIAVLQFVYPGTAVLVDFV